MIYLLFLIIFVFCFCTLFLFIKIFKSTFISVENNSGHTNGGLSYKNKNCRFGTKGKYVDEKNVDYFRDLPCGKDIFRAYWIIYNYHLGDKDEDFIGAILLKWINDGNIKIVVEKKDVLLYFLSKPVNCNEIEEKFYNYILQASFGNKKSGYAVDKVLDSKEFKIWYKRDHSKIASWFGQILDYEIDCLIEEKKINIEKVYKDVKYKIFYNVDESMYDEAVKMAGLKKFLNDFSIMEERESIEVKLFDYYLIYAILLGEADKVFSEFDEFYPYNYMVVSDINIDILDFINFIIN